MVYRIRRTFDFLSYRPRLVLPFAVKDWRKRLEWCRSRVQWNQEWHTVVFNHESRCCLGTHYGMMEPYLITYVKIFPNAPFQPNNARPRVTGVSLNHTEQNKVNLFPRPRKLPIFHPSNTSGTSWIEDCKVYQILNKFWRNFMTLYCSLEWDYLGGNQSSDSINGRVNAWTLQQLLIFFRFLLFCSRLLTYFTPINMCTKVYSNRTIITRCSC